MAPSFREELEALGLGAPPDGFVDVEDAYELDEALEARGILRRPLFQFIHDSRGPCAGDEWDRINLIFRPGEAHYLLWLNDSGTSRACYLEEPIAKSIQDWIASTLAEENWLMYQLCGMEITNHAPDLLPRSYFWRLMQEAYAREPMELSDLDKTWATLEEMFDWGYREEPEDGHLCGCA